MKTLKLTFASLIIVLGLFTIIPAKAATTAPAYGATSTTTTTDATTTTNNNGNGNGNGNGGVGNGNGNGNQDHLPINNGTWFLLIAGVLIGTKVVTDRVKKLKPQTQTA